MIPISLSDRVVLILLQIMIHNFHLILYLSHFFPLINIYIQYFLIQNFKIRWSSLVWHHSRQQGSFKLSVCLKLFKQGEEGKCWAMLRRQQEARGCPCYEWLTLSTLHSESKANILPGLCQLPMAAYQPLAERPPSPWKIVNNKIVMLKWIWLIHNPW